MNNEITIDVNANITVPDKTIERCLKLLEMWQEDNPDKYIEGHTNPDGTTFYRIRVR